MSAVLTSLTSQLSGFLAFAGRITEKSLLVVLVCICLPCEVETLHIFESSGAYIFKDNSQSE